MEFEGTYTAIITPFSGGNFAPDYITDGPIDYNKLGIQIDRQIKAGCNIVVCGTTGEVPTLSLDEHKEMMRFAVERVDGNVEVIAGVGSYNTRHSVELSDYASKVGVDGLLVVTPYYNKGTKTGIKNYFSQVSDVSGLSIIAYNVPGRTTVNMDPDFLEELVHDVPGVVAVKEASGNFGQIQEIARRMTHGYGGEFSLLSGDDAMTFGLMALGGGNGVISVASNIVPERVKAVVDAALEGDFDVSRKLHMGLLPLYKAMFMEINPVPVKTAMRMMGLDSGLFRSPMSGMNLENDQQLAAVLKDYKLC